MVVIPVKKSSFDEIDLTDSLIYAGSHNLSMSAWGKWKADSKKDVKAKKGGISRYFSSFVGK